MIDLIVGKIFVGILMLSSIGGFCAGITTDEVQEGNFLKGLGWAILCPLAIAAIVGVIVLIGSLLLTGGAFILGLL